MFAISKPLPDNTKMALRLTLVGKVLLPRAPGRQLTAAICQSTIRSASDVPVATPSKKITFEVVDNEPTHTGQVFEQGDYRLARFVGRSKEVNTRFAIDLIEEAAPIAVQARATHCDGGDGPLGHPRVFINLDQPGNHACGYCGLRFFQDKSHGHH